MLNSASAACKHPQFFSFGKLKSNINPAHNYEFDPDIAVFLFSLMILIIRDRDLGPTVNMISALKALCR